MVAVKHAKEVATAWVHEHATLLPGFAGAFFHGSINWLPDDAELAPSSDVDLMVVLDGPIPDLKLGKFIFQGVLLEVSYLAQSDIASPEAVLGISHLAGSFATMTVIADPSGQLRTLHEGVARAYATREWVWQRCQDAGQKVERFLRSLDPNASLADNVVSWAFGTSVTTHILLLAGLRNPTVRSRYLATRDLLTAYGQLDLYETLLTQFGAATLRPNDVERHLDALTTVFDVATHVISTPVFFATDLSENARPIAIDGSRAMIARGDHREAMFWIVVTYARCQKVLMADAPFELAAHHETAFRHLLADLGITQYADFQRRAQVVLDSLPTLWDTARELIERNPGIDRR